MWKTIDGFSNYEVSKDGEVRNANTKYILKGRLSKSGYFQVSIKDDNTGKFKNQYIHRLTALAFIENPENKPQVNHKDGVKTNNTDTNLEWSTASENQKHRHSIGIIQTSQRKVGKFDGDKIIASYDSIVEAARAEGSPRVSIDSVLGGRRKTLRGFKWKYLD